MPAHLRGGYAGAARLGHGKGYVYAHDEPDAVAAQQYLPDDLAGATDYYRPTDRGFEARLQERWTWLKGGSAGDGGGQVRRGGRPDGAGWRRGIPPHTLDRAPLATHRRPRPGAALVLLTACAAGPNPELDRPGPAGFWLGLWQGFIVPVTFVISLFTDDVSIYEVGTPGTGTTSATCWASARSSAVAGRRPRARR